MSQINVQRRCARVLGCMILFVLIWMVFLSGRFRLQQMPLFALFIGDSITLDFIRRANDEAELNLSPTMKYLRQCIEPVFSGDLDRQLVPNITEPLTEGFTTLSLDYPDDLRGILGECVPIRLSVSEAYSTRAKFPDLIFGMATTYDRLRESLLTISHWCSNRETKLIVIVEDFLDRTEEVSTLQTVYRNAGVDATFVAPIDKTHSTSQSHFMVLTIMVKESGPGVRWFGLLDDDTFFPHLAPLSEALGSIDHTKDKYVGGLAEDFGSITNFGIMAYGGAGAYLSVHLAKKLGASTQASECISESPPNLGDIILRDCVYHHSAARLTVLPDLYQFDLLGDLRGFFESGAEPLNLHHWKSWYQEPVIAMSVATNFCGNCFLQRWRFGGNTVLSNGYSISTYRQGLEGIDLDRMEQTWGKVYGEDDPHYDYALGALRERVRDENRKTYHLKHAEVTGKSMKQLYVWKGSPELQEPDEVIELLWRS